MTTKSDSIKAPQHKYRPEYCEMLIRHLAQGLSIQTFGGTIGVVRSTVYKWVDEMPEFKEAKLIGLQKAQEFFEKRLIAKVAGQKIQGIDSKTIDTSCLIFALKTRFHETYSEKQNIDITTGGLALDHSSLTPQQRVERIRQLEDLRKKREE